jgi:predicted ATPase
VAIVALHVAGYRSVRDVQLELGPINVLVGPNGCGKTNLYRGMFLLAAAAEGRLARTLADEGGMPSVLWAGARGKGPVRMTLGVTLDDLSYGLSCGLTTPVPGGTAFMLDPEVKEESVWMRHGSRKVDLLKRKNATVWARDDQGSRVTYPLAISESESVLGALREPQRFPELAALRQEFLDWRFYHQFRTDADSPLRQPQVGVRTPILAHDGRDLAAALRTIWEVGDRPRLLEALNEAFPGAQLEFPGAVDKNGVPDARFPVALQMPEFQRPFDARELSDGTLHYLCLLAALLSPRPPSLIALNEPESSIHPDLLEPLSQLLARASKTSQLWITTHSEPLATLIERHSGFAPIRLEKCRGETRVVKAE